MAEKRPMRMCDSCGLIDDHPRHVFAHNVGDAVTSPEVSVKVMTAATSLDSEVDKAAVIAQVQDTATVMKHMDCCRADGCPDGTCNEVTAGAEDKRGNALVRHLTGGK